MRTVQYRILTRILENVVIPDYIYAFEKKKSIPVMAVNHTKRKVVLSVDLKDFFHSIKEIQLRNLFIQLGFGGLPARTLSEICTYESFVPQGALTSPKIANMVTAATFGPKMKEYCDTRNLTLTIYADDLTISSDDEKLQVDNVLSDVCGIIRQSGFKVNHEKTKVMWNNRRQYVCGVVVNEKTNLLRRERYLLRAMVHNTVRDGIESQAQVASKTPEQYVSFLRGKVNWMEQLNPVLGGKLKTKLSAYLKEKKLDDTPDPTTFLNVTESVTEVQATTEDNVPW